MEECAEVSQRASKVLNFGWDEVQADHTENNWDRLRQELNDLMAVTRMMPEFDDDLWDNKLQVAKMEKVEKYLAYSRQLGILDK